MMITIVTIKINDNIDNKVHVSLESFFCIFNVQFSVNTHQVLWICCS